MTSIGNCEYCGIDVFEVYLNGIKTVIDKEMVEGVLINKPHSCV